MTAQAKGPESAERVALVTLGMHRSGTSALSGVLARLGCDTPATPMPTDDRNTKGFYESRPISALNKRILASAGTRWDDWAGVDPAWYDSPLAADFADQALGLVEREFGTSPLIVLKDPRISLLFPFWRDILGRAGYAPRVVFACRGITDVAASLSDRNDFDPTVGHLLWLRYVIEGERASRDVPRVFVHYDRLLSNWPEEIARLETGLDMRLPRRADDVRDAVSVFLTPTMRHFNSDGDPTVEAPAHDWFRAAHDIFDRWSRGDEHPKDQDTLDRIGAEFDHAVPPSTDWSA